MLKVLFEDNHLLVVDKPSGLPTQPSTHSQSSLEEEAKKWIKEKYNKPGKVFLHPIHRLDKSASGIVILGFCPLLKKGYLLSIVPPCKIAAREW